MRVFPTGMTDRLPADLLPAGPTAATFALVLGAATMLGGYLGSRTATAREAASSASPSSWWSPALTVRVGSDVWTENLRPLLG